MLSRHRTVNRLTVGPWIMGWPGWLMRVKVVQRNLYSGWVTSRWIVNIIYIIQTQVLVPCEPNRCGRYVGERGRDGLGCVQCVV